MLRDTIRFSHSSQAANKCIDEKYNASLTTYLVRSVEVCNMRSKEFFRFALHTNVGAVTTSANHGRSVYGFIVHIH
jgi:hypothetical protein